MYRALKKLGMLGLIEERLGNPAEFAAVEPIQALEILVAQKSRQVDRLKSLKQDLGMKLDILARDSASKVVETSEEGLVVKVLSGEQVFRRFKSLVANCQSEILKVISSKSLILYHRIGVPELESERMKTTPIVVRAVTGINASNMNEASDYSKVVTLRHTDDLPSHLRYTIVDRSLLLLPVGEPAEKVSDATALWTNSKALITSLVDDFEKLWPNTIPASEKLEELKTGGARMKIV